MKRNQNSEKSLEKNIQAFEEHLSELENHHKGKWVLFYDGEFIDAFDDFNNAAVYAVKEYGRGPYLIREIGAPPPKLSTLVMRMLETA
ncbi:MAG: hypothetical protein ACR2OT_04955 [Parvibaculales bacterium]